MTEEELIYRKYAKRVLESGMAIWDKYKGSRFGSIRRTALTEKTKALVNHDRFITGEISTRRKA